MDAAPAARQTDDVYSGERLLSQAAALASLGAAAVHFAVVGEHFGEWWLYGSFFAVVAWLQAAWALFAVRGVSGALAWTGAIGNGAVMLIWSLSRTVGVPAGPNAGEVEGIALADVVATSLEVFIVAACLLSLRTGGARRLSPRAFWAALTLVALIVIAVTVASMFNLGSENEQEPMPPGTYLPSRAARA